MVMNVCHVHYLYYTMLLFKKYCFVLNLFIYYYSIVTSLCCDLIESMPMTVHVVRSVISVTVQTAVVDEKSVSKSWVYNITCISTQLPLMPRNVSE